MSQAAVAPSEQTHHQTSEGSEAPAAIAPVSPAPAASRTPRWLQLMTVGVIVAGLVVGVVGALTFAYLAYSVNRAQADAEQLIRVQKVETSLLAADATASNAFLVGGLEPPDQRAAYDQSMVTASTLIAQAARAQPADSDALAALNSELVDYAASIEQARANNRQGLPVGAQYLREASAQLRESAIPILNNLVTSNADRSSAEMKVGIGYLAVAAALVGLIAVVLIQIMVARRFRRRINIGLLASSLVALIALIGSVVVMSQLSSSIGGIQRGSYAELNHSATARIQANNAKSNESLTLIARGSGQSFEAAWATSSKAVIQNLADLDGQADLLTQWNSYAKTHVGIRKLDDDGSWDAAVARATGTGKDSANTSFGAFDASLASYVEQVSGTTAVALAERRAPLVGGAVLMLLAGIAAALLGRAGIGERLKEYR